MDAKEMLRRLQRDEDELTTHLDALKQVVSADVVLDESVQLSATSMLEANMLANWQTLGSTLNALAKAEHGMRQRAVDENSKPTENIIDVQAKDITSEGGKSG